MSEPTLDPSVLNGEQARQVNADAFRIARLWWWARNIATLAVLTGTIALFLAAAYSIAEWMLR